MIGGDCHLVRLHWLYLAGRLHETVSKSKSEKSLDWTIVEVTLGPDSSEASVWVLGTRCWGNMRTRLMTSALAQGVQGERLTLRTMGSWDSG